jgi:hypothetical protein
MYLLDTNVVSELRRQRPHAAVLAWLESVPEDHLFLCSVTLAEIQAGIELTRDQDTKRATELEYWLDEVEDSHTVLDFNSAAARLWAQWMHRRSDTLYEDGMIAAIARVNDLTVVTRNVTDFSLFDVAIFNPFEFSE